MNSAANVRSRPLPRLISTAADIRAAVADLRHSGKKIGIVPTMGALHDGHLSLVRAAHSECDAVVVTVFVNPTQFGPAEDFQKYPRTLDRDLQLLADEQVSLVFVPSNDEMYPAGNSTWIDPPNVAQRLEGTCRPGHFRGVATIVFKLFQCIPADIAFFGQKDFQQCRVIERMVVDLLLPIEIRRCPIIRETDGLAMSSRNRYLSPEQRQQALAISRSLRAGQQKIQSGVTEADLVRDAMRAELADAGITRVDYIAVADPESLEELKQIDRKAVLLIAAHVGSTRLIDNCLVT